MFFATLVVLGFVVAMMAYANVRYGRTTDRKKLFALVLIAFISFALFGDECEESGDVSIGNTQVWDGSSPAGKAVGTAGKALSDAADTMSDATEDFAGGVLNTDFSDGNSLCDGLGCSD